MKALLRFRLNNTTKSRLREKEIRQREKKVRLTKVEIDHAGREYIQQKTKEKIVTGDDSHRPPDDNYFVEKLFLERDQRN